MFNNIIPYFPIPFFVQITRVLSVGNLSNVYRACSFFMISDPFCIDNAHVIGQKIWYYCIQISNSLLFLQLVPKTFHVSVLLLLAVSLSLSLFYFTISSQQNPPAGQHSTNCITLNFLQFCHSLICLVTVSDVSTSFFLSVFSFLPPSANLSWHAHNIHGSYLTVSLESKWFLLFSFISTPTHMHTQGTDIFLPESGLVLTAILISSACIHHSTSLAASTSSSDWKIHHCFTGKREIHMTILWQTKGYLIRSSLNLLTFTKKQ